MNMDHPTTDVSEQQNRESIQVVYTGIGRRMLCPECHNPMPVDHSGECSNCGTHFRVEIVW